MLGEKVLLKVSPKKEVMKFRKKYILSWTFISPFEILEMFGDMEYRLALHPCLSDTHPKFLMSILKRYCLDDTFVIQWNSVALDHYLSFNKYLIAILDIQTRKLSSKHID